MKKLFVLKPINTHVQKVLFMIKELSQIKKNSFSKLRINKFNFKLTDLFLDRLSKLLETSAGMRRKMQAHFILVHS